MASYPAAEILNYGVVRNDDLLLPSLLSNEQVDHEFVQPLLSNDYIHKLFTMQLEHRIHKDARRNYK